MLLVVRRPRLGGTTSAVCTHMAPQGSVRVPARARGVVLPPVSTSTVAVRERFRRAQQAIARAPPRVPRRVWRCTTCNAVLRRASSVAEGESGVTATSSPSSSSCLSDVVIGAGRVHGGVGADGSDGRKDVVATDDDDDDDDGSEDGDDDGGNDGNVGNDDDDDDDIVCDDDVVVFDDDDEDDDDIVIVID